MLHRQTDGRTDEQNAHTAYANSAAYILCYDVSRKTQYVNY